MLVSNHQATDSKKNKFTIIVLKSADPYLPDRVAFKHTSLLFKFNVIRKNLLNVDISSTTYLFRIVNVVKERLLIVKKKSSN